MEAVRLVNNCKRSSPGDDAFPVFDVMVTGTEENLKQFLTCIEGCRDGGFDVIPVMIFENSKELKEDIEENGNGHIKY